MSITSGGVNVAPRRSVVITGASTGIGWATALALDLLGLSASSQEGAATATPRRCTWPAPTA